MNEREKTARSSVRVTVKMEEGTETWKWETAKGKM
jgi:hypothetical protein